MIRVLVVDDQELIRDAFAVVLDLQDDIEVVGAVGDGAQAVAAASRLRPDVVLMDVRMPNMHGLEATRRILAGAGPDGPKVLVLTTFDLDEYAYAALRAGASGFLLKDAPRSALVTAVRDVVRGDTLLAPTLTRRLVQEFLRHPPRSKQRPAQLASLSEREVEVLVLVARGLSNAEIAAALVVADATVKTHVAHVLAKLGLRDRVQAVVLAYECGLAPADPQN